MAGPYPDRINAIRKYVLSSTLQSVEWNNSTIISGDVVGGASDPKQQGDGHLVVYGYGRLAQTLLEHNLVDDLDFSIHPTVLEHETPLFRPGQTKALRNVSGEERSNGVVSLLYSKA